MKGRGSSAFVAGVILLGLVAGAMRANNASVYQLHWGFDAPWNWEYVEHLTHTWELPAPHEGWSYAQPPLFFYGSAVLARAMDGASKRDVTRAIRWVSSGILPVRCGTWYHGPCSYCSGGVGTVDRSTK